MKNLFPKILLFTFLFLIFPVASFAQVIINEIMYAPSTGSGEWIEIFNSGNNSIDLNDWRFFNNEDDSAPLRLQKGSAILIGKEYAIITTTSYWDSFQGNVFSSSQFSLPDNSSKYNTYKAISDPNKQIIDFIIYDTNLGGNKESGNSLQKTASSWIAAPPTPGRANTTTENPSNSTGEVLGDMDESNSSSFDDGDSTSSVSSPSAKLEVSAGGDRTTSPGSPIWFQATINKNTTKTGAELNWSFGDGNIGVGSLVSHTYKYSGDYVVVLSAKAKDIFSISRLKVRVIDSNLQVLDKGDYLEIINNNNTEINLFNWKIECEGKGFIFQPDTIVLPKSSIKFDKSILKMKGLDNSMGISLKNYLGEEVFYTEPVEEIDSEKIVSQINEIQKQAYSLINKAISAKLVIESSPIPKNTSLSYQGEVLGNFVEPEQIVEEIERETISNLTENIIYEVPEGRSWWGRVWDFVRGK